jgi:L-amino acid N-acyltransferase YncA
VRAIYLEGIATGNATFEREALEWENWSAARGTGVATALLAALIEASEASGIRTLQAGIFPDNAANGGRAEP